MSAAHTTHTPAAQAAGAGRRRSLLRWLAGGALLAALLTALAIAVWPASETDKARADGEQLGQAVAHLYDAQSSAEVDDALAEVHAAAADTREHAGDAVAGQVADQEDALDRAADGFAGVHTSTDAFDVDLYQAELNDAVDDLANQADDLRTQGPENQQAFWDGCQTGLDAA
jgi:hypothetical protein